MLHVKPKKSKSGIKLNMKLHKQGMQEVFVGTRTIIGFLIFTISGVLVGRSFWEYGVRHIGLESTTIIGLIAFIITGLLLHKFRK